jgi:hypothetical protein
MSTSGGHDDHVDGNETMAANCARAARRGGSSSRQMLHAQALRRRRGGRHGHSTGLHRGRAAGAASTVPQSAGPLIYTTSQAGYVTGGGRLFRFVATTVVVPYLQFQAGNNGSAEVVLGSRVGPPATLRVAAGGGTGSISYVWSIGTEFHTGHLYGVAPAPGDLLRLSVYYDRLGHDFFTATDTTQGVTQTARVDVVPVIYTAAEAAGVIDNATVAAPKTDTRLWAFSGTRVTTYTGVHGTLLGPWTTYQVIDTTTGTSAGAVVISSPVLWNNGQNFGVWLRTTA